MMMIHLSLIEATIRVLNAALIIRLREPKLRKVYLASKKTGFDLDE
jgi:hypothetical protein